MPMNRKDYPPDWEDISRFIRFERADGKCERCGAPHGALIVRDPRHPEHYETLDDMEAEIAALEGERVIRVVLTTAHLPEAASTMDCRPEVLAALCQRCHFHLDRERHLATRAAKRAQERQTVGQLILSSRRDMEEEGKP